MSNLEAPSNLTQKPTPTAVNADQTKNPGLGAGGSLTANKSHSTTANYTFPGTNTTNTTSNAPTPTPIPFVPLLFPAAHRTGSSPASLPARSPFSMNAQTGAGNDRSNGPELGATGAAGGGGGGGGSLIPSMKGASGGAGGAPRFQSHSPLPGSGAVPNQNSPSSHPQLDHGVMSPDILANRTSGQNDETDAAKLRQQRLETIVSTLKKRDGRISEESIERVAKHNGLSVLWDPPLSEPARRDNSRTLTIAGTALMVDIEFVASLPVKVMASLPESEDDIGLDEEAISRVLKNTLVANTPIDLLSRSLGPFAKNIERLARMEKLSVPSFNCHTAASGIYKSLQKLYEFEKAAMVKEKLAKGIRHPAYAVADVICRRSGRPRLNSQNQIGISIEYWIDSRVEKARLSRLSSESDQSQHQISQNQASSPDVPPDDSINFSDVYSLTIECERLQNPMVGPARSGGGWISDSVMGTTQGPDGQIYSTGIGWLEPPPTIVAPKATDPNFNPLAVELPDIQFVAKLNPPVPIPWSAAEMIYQSVNAPEVLSTVPFRRFENLLLSDPADRPTMMSWLRDPVQMTFRNKTRANVGSSEEGKQPRQREHNTVLNVRRTQYGILLESIPFSHPRMLLNIIPTLRQYAFLSRLLRGYFTSPTPPPSLTDPQPNDEPDPFDFPGPETSYISQIYLSSLSEPTHPRPLPSPALSPVSRMREDGVKSTAPTGTTAKTIAGKQGLDFTSQLETLEVAANVTLVGASPRLTISFANIWSPRHKSRPSSTFHQARFPLSPSSFPNAPDRPAPPTSGSKPAPTGPAPDSSSLSHLSTPFVLPSLPSVQPDPETLMTTLHSMAGSVDISTQDNTVVFILSFLPDGRVQILDHNLFRLAGANVLSAAAGGRRSGAAASAATGTDVGAVKPEFPANGAHSQSLQTPTLHSPAPGTGEGTGAIGTGLGAGGGAGASGTAPAPGARPPTATGTATAPGKRAGGLAGAPNPGSGSRAAPFSSASETERLKRRLQTSLDVAGDLGVWIEWIGKQYFGQSSAVAPS